MPYVGAGVLSSAIVMDKTVTKLLLAAKGLPVVDYTNIRDHEWDRDRTSVLNSVQARHRFPLFVKPSTLALASASPR